jgi:hypothetical protein
MRLFDFKGQKAAGNIIRVVIDYHKHSFFLGHILHAVSTSLSCLVGEMMMMGEQAAVG